MDTTVYSNDRRVEVVQKARQNGTRKRNNKRADSDWILHIHQAHPSDSGIYECQINTEPKKSKEYHLHIVGKYSLVVFSPTLWTLGTFSIWWMDILNLDLFQSTSIFPLVYFFLLAAFLSASFYIFVFSFVVHVPQFSQILRFSWYSKFSDFLNSLLFKIFRFSNFFILCSRL